MDLRDAIRLVEALTSGGYFHGSRRALPIGAVLRPSLRHPEAESRAVETILEHYRPQDALQRASSVFMVDQPDADLIERAGGYADHILQVVPNGPVFRNDINWWAEVLTYAYDWLAERGASRSRTLAACKPMAIAYWHGEASERPLWEYRAASATVSKIIR